MFTKQWRISRWIGRVNQLLEGIHRETSDSLGGELRYLKERCGVGCLSVGRADTKRRTFGTRGCVKLSRFYFQVKNASAFSLRKTLGFRDHLTQTVSSRADSSTISCHSSDSSTKRAQFLRSIILSRPSDCFTDRTGRHEYSVSRDRIAEN